jgi:hypothetical protein
MSPPGPPDDPDDVRPKPLMGPLFWVMLAFGAVCILAGVAMALWAPRLLAGG